MLLPQLARLSRLQEMVPLLYPRLASSAAALYSCNHKTATDIPGDTFTSRLSYSTQSADDDITLDRKKKVNKLLYRSKQRGFLELDLLVGKWTESNVATMDDNVMKDLDVLLDEENPDLFKWLTGQSEVPQHIAGNAAFKLMQSDVRGAVEKHSNNQTRSQQQPWVRGWDDAWRNKK